MNSQVKHPQLNATRRYTILGAIFGLTFPLVGTVLEALLSGLPLNIATMIYIQRNDSLLWIVDTAPIVVGLFARYAGYKQDLLTNANNQLHQRENELKSNQENLERYADERTAELTAANQRNERRASQLEAIAHITRTISAIQALNELLPQITRIISEQFGFYQVGIFLLDPAKEYATLAAANSEDGRKLVESNYRLRIGGPGIVSFVSHTGQPRIVLDVGTDPVYLNTPEFKNTRSEIALPLRIGTDMFGVLDVQSTETSAFTQEDISLLSILADQVSIAIQNARFYQQLQEALAQAETASVETSHQQWQQFLLREPVEGYYFDGVETIKITSSDRQRAHSLSVPLILRGAHIGTLKLSTTDSSRVWTDDEIDIAHATAERTSIALENARLLAEAQKRAAKERAISEISAKIGNLNSLENLLQATIRELGHTLPDTDVAIQISTEKPRRT